MSQTPGTVELSDGGTGRPRKPALNNNIYHVSPQVRGQRASSTPRVQLRGGAAAGAGAKPPAARGLGSTLGSLPEGALRAPPRYSDAHVLALTCTFAGDVFAPPKVGTGQRVAETGKGRAAIPTEIPRGNKQVSPSRCLPVSCSLVTPPTLLVLHAAQDQTRERSGAQEEKGKKRRGRFINGRWFPCRQKLRFDADEEDEHEEEDDEDFEDLVDEDEEEEEEDDDLALSPEDVRAVQTAAGRKRASGAAGGKQPSGKERKKARSGRHSYSTADYYAMAEICAQNAECDPVTQAWGAKGAALDEWWKLVRADKHFKHIPVAKGIIAASRHLKKMRQLVEQFGKTQKAKRTQTGGARSDLNETETTLWQLFWRWRDFEKQQKEKDALLCGGGKAEMADRKNGKEMRDKLASKVAANQKGRGDARAALAGQPVTRAPIVDDDEEGSGQSADVEEINGVRVAKVGAPINDGEGEPHRKKPVASRSKPMDVMASMGGGIAEGVQSLSAAISKQAEANKSAAEAEAATAAAVAKGTIELQLAQARKAMAEAEAMELDNMERRLRLKQAHPEAFQPPGASGDRGGAQ